MRVKPVVVNGFVIHPEDWPEELSVSIAVCPDLLRGRCLSGRSACANCQRAETYPVDSWLEVTGQMTTENAGRTPPSCDRPNCTSTTIEEPENPYQY